MRPALALLFALAGCRQLLGLDSPEHGPTDAIADTGDAARDAPVVSPDAGGGSIAVVAVALGSEDVDLSTEGTSDWAHWGLNGAAGFDHKLTGGLIGNATPTGAGVVLGLTAVQVTATWNDGTPDIIVNATDTAIGVAHPGGLTFVVPATAMLHTLRLYVGGDRCVGRLDLSLSDGSAPPYHDDQFSSPTTAFHSEYTIEFSARTPNASLVVTWSDETALAAPDYASLLSATLE